MDQSVIDERQLRRAVLIVAGLNFAYFFVEFSVALTAGSVSLLADSVDFLEDTSINLLLALVIGGVGSLWGAAIGAVLLTFLPEWLSQLQNAYGIVFGALVIILLTIEPDGIVGIVRRLIEAWRHRGVRNLGERAA